MRRNWQPMESAPDGVPQAAQEVKESWGEPVQWAPLPEGGFLILFDATPWMAYWLPVGR